MHTMLDLSLTNPYQLCFADRPSHLHMGVSKFGSTARYVLVHSRITQGEVALLRGFWGLFGIPSPANKVLLCTH